MLTQRPQSPDAGRGADAERKGGGGLFLILNVFLRLRDTLSRGFLILLRAQCLRSGGGGVAFGDGNPLEPFA